MEQVTTISQSYPPNWLGNMTLTINYGYVLRDWKSLTAEHHTKVELKELGSDYDTGRREYNDWDNVAFMFLFASFILSIVRAKLYLSLPFLIFALAFFAVRFLKCDWAYFYDSDHAYVFSVRLAKGDESAANFVATLVDEIKKSKA